jgi:hypothetical protein
MLLPRKKLKSPVENQRKITFFLGQMDESNQDSTEDIATTGNSDNTSDTPVELRKFQNRWCSLIPWVTYKSKENKMFCKLCQDIGAENILKYGMVYHYL